MADIGHDTPERRGRAIALLDADLHGLLQIKEVTEVLQAKISVARVRSISKLSTIADDRAGIRNFCTNTLALDAVADMVDVAAIVDAWEASTTRMRVRHNAEAEASLAAVPRAVPKVEVQDLMNRFEALHGYKLEDKTTPATSTLEVVFDQIEAGELKQMSLTQMVSKDDAESEMIGATIEKSTGAIKVRKGYGECPKPKTAEELRRRMAVLANCYLLAQLKFPQKAALKDLMPRHYLRYVEYLLGEHVYGLKATNKDGESVATPELGTVMAYDFQMRRQMVRQVNEGKTMVEALKAVMEDPALKERHFITPNVMAMMNPPSSSYKTGPGKEAARSRSPPGGQSGGWNHPAGGWQQHGKSRGKGGGKAKGKRSRELHDRTPDGRQICWRWNSHTQRCRFDCGRLHVCVSGASKSIHSIAVPRWRRIQLGRRRQTTKLDGKGRRGLLPSLLSRESVGARRYWECSMCSVGRRGRLPLQQFCKA